MSFVDGLEVKNMASALDFSGAAPTFVNTLYSIDLQSGVATSIGNVSVPPGTSARGLAVRAAPNFVQPQVAF